MAESPTTSEQFLLKISPDGFLGWDPIRIDGGGVGGGVVVVDAEDSVHLPFREWVTYSSQGARLVNQERTTIARYTHSYAVDSAEAVYFINNFTGPHRVARLMPGLIYDRIAGDLEPGFAGDGGPASASRLDNWQGQMLLASDDSLYIADRENGRVRRINRVSECPSGGPRPLPLSVGSAANYQSLAPGSVFTLFGVRLGPAELVSATVSDQNRLPFELAGTRVSFDGVLAPLLYVSEGQLAGIVPFVTKVNTNVAESGAWTLTEPVARLAVETAAGVSDDHGVQIFPTSPAIFTLDASGRGPAAALNQDGSLNTADNPARSGEVVVMWATGFGAMNPTPTDGEITAGSLPVPAEPVEVLLSGQSTELLYAGAAPGLVAGVVQLNVRIPPTQTNSGPVEVTVKAGNLTPHRGVTVFVAE